MLILFLKSKPGDRDEQVPLLQKLRRVFLLRVKEARTDQDRARAQRELDKLTSITPDEKGNGPAEADPSITSEKT